MGKKELVQKETQVATGEGIGKQLEQSLTVDDNCLPSPQELEAYKKIDPKIVEYLINASVEEQRHRHNMDNDKMKMVDKADKRDRWMNWWGMCFAFLSILVMVGLAGIALYWDKQWIAGIMGATTLLSVASIFVKNGENR